MPLPKIRMTPRRWVAAAALIALLGSAVAVLMAQRSGGSEEVAGSAAVAPQPTYVGSDACAQCHAREAAAWRPSQHAQAMQPAAGKAVAARVDGKGFRHRGGETRYSARDGKLFVNTAGPDGKPGEFEVSHTFGVYPLQQYLASFPDGRRQALGVAWDSRSQREGGQRWFHLFPEDGAAPGEARHWVGIDQNWNYQCADCHSTNLRKNFDAATDRFATTWSEISVGCEACHGPGSAHLAWAAKPPAERGGVAGAGLTARLDERRGATWQAGVSPQRSAARGTQREIEVCARCHARRGQFSDAHVAGQPLLDAYQPALLEPGLYFADGQQQDEVFNYGSFLQSRMNAAGVTCSDCHEPHSGKVRAEGNPLCTQCHSAATFDTAGHHHHPPGAGAQCVACHMPQRTYMGVDQRRDHSFRIPRPDRSLSLGVPNACDSCHEKKGAAWAAAAIRRWYPTPKGGAQDFAEAFRMAELEAPGALPKLREIVADAARPGWVRASALRRLSLLPEADAAGQPASLQSVTALLGAEDDTLRWTAVNAMASFPARERAYYLAPCLGDARRLVRIEAARHLAGEAEALLPESARPAFAAALKELIAAEQFNADRPEAMVRLGDLHAARGQGADAEQAYRRALGIDPKFAPASVNLAQMLEQQGRPDAAMELLRQAAAYNERSAEIQHALGLALIRQGQPGAALAHLGKAASLRPEAVRMVYVHVVAEHDIAGVKAALKPLRAALGRHPRSALLNELGVRYFVEAGERKAAEEALQNLGRIDPGRAEALHSASLRAEPAKAGP